MSYQKQRSPGSTYQRNRLLLPVLVTWFLFLAQTGLCQEQDWISAINPKDYSVAGLAHQIGMSVSEELHVTQAACGNIPFTDADGQQKTKQGCHLLMVETISEPDTPDGFSGQKIQISISIMEDEELAIAVARRSHGNPPNWMLGHDGLNDPRIVANGGSVVLGNDAVLVRYQNVVFRLNVLGRNNVAETGKKVRRLAILLFEKLSGLGGETPDVAISANHDRPTVYDTVILTANATASVHDKLSYTWFLNGKRQTERGRQLDLGQLEEGWYRARVVVDNNEGGLTEAELDFAVQLPMILEVKNEPTLAAPLTFIIYLRYLDAEGIPRPLAGRELTVHAFNIMDNWAKLRDSIGIDSPGVPRITDMNSPIYAKTRDDGKFTLIFYPDFAKIASLGGVPGVTLPAWNRPLDVEIRVDHVLEDAERPEYNAITHSDSALARLYYMAFVSHIGVQTPSFQTGHQPHTGPIHKGQDIAFSRYESSHDPYRQRWNMGQSRVQFKRSGAAALSAPGTQSGWGEPLRQGQKLGSGDQILIDARELEIVPNIPTRLPIWRLRTGTGNIQVYLTYLDQFQGAVRVREKLPGQAGFRPFEMVIGTPEDQFHGWSLYRWIASQIGDQIVEKSLRSVTASSLSLLLPGAGKIYGIQSTLGAISDISRFGDSAYIRVLNTAYHVMSDGEGQISMSTRKGEVGVSNKPNMADSRMVPEGHTALLSQDGGIVVEETDSALAQMADELLGGPLDEYGSEITTASISQDHTGVEPSASRSPELEIQQPAPASKLSNKHGLPSDLSQELEKLLASARHHVTQGEFEQALAALDRALEISPTNQEAEGNLRRVQYLMDAADRQLKQVYELAAREQFNEARERLVPIKNANPRYPPVQEAEEYLRKVQWARSQVFQEAMGQMRLAMERRDIEEALGRIEQIRQDFMLSSHETKALRDNEIYLSGLLSRKNEARELFRSGEEKLHSHDYRGAIEDFRAAYWTGQNLWSMSDPEPNHYSPMLAKALRRHERIFELLPHIDRAAKGDITIIDVNQIRTALSHVDELLILQPGAPELLEYQRLLHDRLEGKIGASESVMESTPARETTAPIKAVAPEPDPRSRLTAPNRINLASASGMLSQDNQDQHHTIEVPRHGGLRAEIRAESDLRVWMQLFDNGGNRLAQTSTDSAIQLEREDLAPGVYHVRVIRSSGEGSYQLRPTLTSPSIENDTEPNDSFEQAAEQRSAIPVNQHATGLLGFLSLNDRDTEDWFRFETGGNGIVTVTVEAEESLRVWMQLFDDQGNRLAQTSAASSLELARPDLAPGIYLARLIHSSGQGGYVITPTFEANRHSNDQEPNNEAGQAQTIRLGQLTEGLLGYVTRNESDTEDWFRFEISGNGTVTVSVEAEESLRVWMQLFDDQGNRLAQTSAASSLELARPDLAPGTYLARLIHSSGQGGYVITPTFEANRHSNDQEPNNEVGQAQTIRLGQLTKGLLGYVTRNERDTEDWFRFETGGNGIVTVSVEAEESLRVWMQLLDDQGNRLAQASTASSLELVRPDLAPSTYLVRLIHSSGQGGYVITPTFEANRHSNDQEPNNEAGQAQTIRLGQLTEGLLGYVTRNERDTEDWFRFETSGNGTVTISVEAEESLRVWMQLFDDQGNRLAQASTASSLELASPDLAPGTYLARLIRSSGQGGYTIKSAFRSTSGNP